MTFWRHWGEIKCRFEDYLPWNKSNLVQGVVTSEYRDVKIVE